MPARHESLQGDLLAKSNIGSDSSGRRKRVSARHQVKRLDRDLEKLALFGEAVGQKKSVSSFGADLRSAISPASIRK
jgi:hypothetical protein